MNISRKVCQMQYRSSRINYRKFWSTAANPDASSAAQPEVYEKLDFEDLKVIERVERRHAKIQPFIKDVFVSIFNRDLLAFPEILNKEESNDLENRISTIEKVFNDQTKTTEERKNTLKENGMYGAPVRLTKGGFAMNVTESLRYLDVIASDLQLGLEISNHWICLNVLKLGLSAENYDNIIDDLMTGDATIALCIKEKISERILQADFKTNAELDQNGVWRITGEKICLQPANYLLVLSLVEGNRYKAFLVHPNAIGVNFGNSVVTLYDTPATPLDEVSDEELSKALGLTRLHTATICRNSLLNSVRFCLDYVRPRFFSGKPLSELSSIQAVFGEAMVTSYASESAEYFTAGLLDGYEDPDAEVEMAMCRNFIAKHSQDVLLRLLAIPGVEKKKECLQLMEDMRTLSLQGETVEHVNTFIGLHGLHHAGQMLADEVKKVRNPLFNPTFIIRKLVANRHQEKDEPKLNLYLSEHLHPTLAKPAEGLEYGVLRMRYAVETLMARHGADVTAAFTEVHRLAEAGSEILAMTAVLARASRSYCIGVRHGEEEMKLAACFVTHSKERVRRLIREIDEGEYMNLDHFRIGFGKRLLNAKGGIVEKPTARVFW